MTFHIKFKKNKINFKKKGGGSYEEKGNRLNMVSLYFIFATFLVARVGFEHTTFGTET